MHQARQALLSYGRIPARELQYYHWTLLRHISDISLMIFPLRKSDIHTLLDVGLTLS